MWTPFLRALGTAAFAYMICLLGNVDPENTLNSVVLGGFWGFLDYYIING